MIYSTVERVFSSEGIVVHLLYCNWLVDLIPCNFWPPDLIFTCTAAFPMATTATDHFFFFAVALKVFFFVWRVSWLNVLYLPSFSLKQLQEQQKHLSHMEEEQLKSSAVTASSEKPQGQEVEVQTDSTHDEEDARISKLGLSKTLSFETSSAASQDDREKFGSAIRRSKTLPVRLKATQVEVTEDKTGNHSCRGGSGGVEGFLSISGESSYI